MLKTLGLSVAVALCVGSLVSVLAACGQKGALTLPQAAASATSGATR